MSDQILSFQWTGINREGKRLKGVIKATDVKVAEAELKTNNVEIISIEQKQALKFSIPWFKRSRIKSRHIFLFTRYLSTMLSAGMPILRALEVLAKDPDNTELQSVILAIRADISEGRTLADSFGKFPRLFDPLYVSLVRAGEKSGTLDKILLRLSMYLEKAENLRAKVKKALIYPCAIVVVAMVVSFILLFFVMPQFQSIFSSYGAKLPVFTRMVLGLSNFLRAWWYIIFTVLGFGIYTFYYSLKHSEPFAYKFDKFILRVPVVGQVVQKGIIARFASTLAITLDAGLPIIESMRAMSPIMDNRVYSHAIDSLTTDIASGHTLSTSLADTKVFPNIMVQMTAVGEASGTLSKMLENVANFYEQEVNNVVDNLSALLEPIILVILGLIIGSFVIAMYLPIFNLGSVMGHA